jgi:glycosyltransferase involved in cell wall biosynthesis
MKILQVIYSVSDDSGGPVIGVKNLAQALASENHEVTVCGTERRIKRTEKARTYGYTIYKFPLRTPYGYYYSPALGDFLRKGVKEYDAVHIHGIWTYPTFIASRICKANNVPYIIRTCGMLDFWSMSQRPIKKRIYFYLAERQNLKNASFIQFSMKREFERSFYKKWEDKRLKYIPNILYLRDIDVADAEPTSRLANKRYILFFGKLCYKKGLDVLIEAFALLQREAAYKNIYLVLMGSDRDNYFEKLKKKISYLEAGSKIINIGMIYGDKRFGIVKRALFMCLPSRQENLGLSIIETLACGVPVLVSDSVDIAHLIAKEYAGKISSINPGKLCSVMKEMIEKDEERAKMGHNGKRFVYKKFDKEAVLRDYITMYGETGKAKPGLC